jgi:3-deoxy-7-phosphoheptulonate synthase
MNAKAQTNSGFKDKRWWPSSWRMLPALQQPEYADVEALNAVLARLRHLAPLVRSAECVRLKRQLAQVAAGRAFLLQGGDCAERFNEGQQELLRGKLKLLAQVGRVLQQATRQPVVHIARMAGQYTKPRSQGMESVNGVQMPSYRGDLINGLEADPAARRADPERLLQGYFHAAAVLNYIRGVNEEGPAALGLEARDWRLEVLGDLRMDGGVGYRELIQQLQEGMQPPPTGSADDSGHCDFFVSHEGLHLGFEESMTGLGSDGQHYNLGTHYLWLGERTRQLDGAHIEYFRGIANPIGVKVGPSCTPEELQALIRTLNPHNEPGRLTLITRFGKSRIAESLPRLIRATRQMGARVIWSCDPMHGNGIVSSQGVKTRQFESILAEVRAAFEIHDAEGSSLGGLHLECAGDDVTECLGGAEGLSEGDLSARYTTACDPRLNPSQTLELAYGISDCLRRSQHGAFVQRLKVAAG